MIGLVTLPSDYPQFYGPKNFTYFRSSYVKFIESGGARVVPISTNLSTSNLLALLADVNGVIIPCGY